MKHFAVGIYKIGNSSLVGPHKKPSLPPRHHFWTPSSHSKAALIPSESAHTNLSSSFLCFPSFQFLLGFVILSNLTSKQVC